MGGHKEDAGRASQPDIRAGEGCGADHPEVLSHLCAELPWGQAEPAQVHERQLLLDQPDLLL